MRFTKMHGLGNDYIFVNCFEEKVVGPEKISPVISDRHRGIGGDGLILICPSEIADVKMRIFNADGSEAQMCGNGIRCVAKYAYEHKLVKSKNSAMTVETGRGVLTLGLEIDKKDKVEQIRVNMGRPILEPAKIPVAIDGDSVIEAAIDVGGQRMLMTCVSMGNPHVVFFVDDLDAVNLEKVGPVIEHHELFPERVNAHFVRVDSRKEFTMRTWERGSGITLACGTGASACCAAAVLTDRCGRGVTAHLPGGDLRLEWSQEDNCVYMTGPAAEVFTGDWPIS
ncbi:MAG: diaminopimelate epimerase [Planctomycetes bacterium]|nr:diaminopimelate epimerase [Planctomycetota bacterium]